MTPADRSKFETHAGLAFGIFRRYVYKPFRAGAFNGPTQGKLAFEKAAAASLSAFHEVTLAKLAAQRSTVLRELYAPMAELQLTLSSLANRLKRNHPDRADIEATNGTIASILKSASSSGVKIAESATPAS